MLMLRWFRSYHSLAEPAMALRPKEPTYVKHCLLFVNGVATAPVDRVYVCQTAIIAVASLAAQ
jgi:hypothetical protein